jgi:CHAD domain-containing protein
MRIELPEKWIAAAAADEQIHHVAARTLQSRLGAVLKLLPLAANKAHEDIEYIHELRVWTRRATAALDLYAELMPRRQFFWIKKQLKRVRKAANEARDCDVHIARLKQQYSGRATKHWLIGLRAERQRSQKAVIDAYDRLRRDHRFERRIDKLLQKVLDRIQDKVGAAPKRFVLWAQEHLSPLVEQFFAAIPSDRTDEAALHRLRICGKQLRYDMELLAGAFPAEFRTELYATIEAMLDRLGEINDLVTAKIWLQKLKAASRKEDAASWRRLLATEEAQLSQVLESFWEWFNPQTRQQLREGFEAMLELPPQPRGAFYDMQCDPLPAVAGPPQRQVG